MNVVRVSDEVDWSRSTYVGRRNRMVQGRPGADGRFANPFPLAGTSDRDRYEAIVAFADWVRGDSARAHGVRAAVGGLIGRDLVCWCAPRRCHGEILRALAGVGPGVEAVLESMRIELVGESLFD